MFYTWEEWSFWPVTVALPWFTEKVIFWARITQPKPKLASVNYILFQPSIYEDMYTQDSIQFKVLTDVF